MEINKLIELYQKLQLDSSPIKNLNNLTDQEIEIILNCKEINRIIELILNNNFYLNNLDTREKILNILINTESLAKRKCIIEISTNPKIIKNNQFLELITIIIDAKESKLADIVNVIFDYSVIKINEVINFSKIVSNSYYTNIITEILTNEVVQKSGYAIEIAKVIDEAQSYSIAQFAANIAMNKNIPNRYRLKLTKIIANSINPINAQAAKYVIESKTTSNKDNPNYKYLIEVTSVIVKIKNPNIAFRTANLTHLEGIIEDKMVVELIKIVSQSKDEPQATSCCYMLSDHNVIATNEYLELAKIVTNCKTETKADFTKGIAERTSRLAIEKGIITTKQVVELTKQASQLKLNKNQKLPTNFWIDFEKEPQKTLNELEQYLKEIDAKKKYQRVRKLQK